MKCIEKAPKPPGYLTRWVNSSRTRLLGKNGDEQWKLFKGGVKKRLQSQLLAEQGHICAYCNQRIHGGHPEDDQQMRMDHFAHKSHPENLSRVFDYYNLVGSCFGDERSPKPRTLHCDPRKSNSILDPNLYPTHPQCEEQLIIELLPDGARVMAKTEQIQDSVERVLNLNHPKLQELRKNALEPFNVLEQDITPDEASELLNAYLQRNENGYFQPFAGVIITYLKQEFL